MPTGNSASDAGDGWSLEAARASLQTALNEGDVDALAAIVTDDVVWHAAGQSPWVGRAQVVSGFRRAFESYDFQFQITDAQIDGDADRAVERSNFVSHVANEAGPVGPPHLGSAVLLWTRSDQWRVAAYIDVGPTLFK